MTATYPPRQQLRECRLYRFYVLHPVTGEVVLGYVGETGRQPFERLLEHLASQPWFDTVVRWEVDPQPFWGKSAVLKAEAAAIRIECPLYNVKGNEQNRGRIPPPVAIKQRRARDVQKGADRWVHPADRGQPQPVPRKPVRTWSRGQEHTLRWAIAWLVLTVGGWVGLVINDGGGWKQTGTTAAVLSAAVVGWLARWVWLGRPWTRKAWRRAARKRRRR